MNLTNPSNIYIIVSDMRLNDIKKWKYFKLDLGTSVYSLNKEDSNLDYIVGYHAEKFGKIIYKLGNAINVNIYSSIIDTNKIQLVKNGILLESLWDSTQNIEDVLKSILLEYEEKYNNINKEEKSNSTNNISSIKTENIDDLEKRKQLWIKYLSN